MTYKSNNSVVYLALLCLLYFFLTSNYMPLPSIEENPNHKGLLYVEISEDGITTVKDLSNADELRKIKTQYSISNEIKSGDKIVVNENSAAVTKISGRKRISLGIPIGINSATSEDLKAIPGVGHELAYRIISTRNTKGKFVSLDELDSIDGIGSKKLRKIKNHADID